MNTKIIDNIIELLEYNKSNDLYYFDNINCKNIKISATQMKCLNDIKPYAIYVKDNNPFVIFIDGEYLNKEENRKIWNMQIPIVMCISQNVIKIYDGTNLDIKKKEIKLIDEEEINEFFNKKSFSFWDVHNVDYLQKYHDKSNNLNNLLLKNIKYLNEKLKCKYKVKFATKLVLRIIFIRFLIDKGVDIDYSDFSCNIEENRERFIEITKSRKNLYDLFKHLKEKFNGNLFDIEKELDDINLCEEVFELISDFISAKQDLESNQISFFDIYDFDIIPISLISAIYEIVLGEEKQEKDKAFYTPDYLVDHLLKNIEIKDKKNFKVLDPSCGSGIFLVKVSQKILDNNVDEDGYISDDQKINKLLMNNIFGVDINEEAIDISIFSIYLVILEYKNPKTLQNYKFPTLKNTNLIVADFFDDSKVNKILNYEFDLIIGNPPWGSIKNNNRHIEFCKSRNLPVQNNEISRSFLFKSIEICKKNTVCCLVLPSSILYNIEKPAKIARKIILENVKIEQIIELSAVRKLLFENATAPTFCLFFRKDDADYLKNIIKYTSLKPNIYFELFNAICIEKDDTKQIYQYFLKENDWAWKTALYGSYFDFEIIMKLKRNYKTIDDLIKKMGLKCGTGLATNIGDAKDSSMLVGKKILDAGKDIDSFYVNNNPVGLFDKKSIHRIPDLEIFKAPYILIRKGIETQSFKIRAGYSENDFLFTNAITSIKGNSNNKDELLNMLGLLNSSLYAYLNLMLASSVGIEREQHYKKEILDKPYIYSEDIVKYVKEIISIRNSSVDTNLINSKIEMLDNIILEKFGLLNNEAVDYALNIEIPNIANKLDYIYLRADEKDLKRYAQYFFNYFKELFYNEKFIKINLYPNVNRILSIFELEIMDNKPSNSIEVKYEVDNEKKFLSGLIIDKVENIMYARDILHFEEKSFYIIKSNELKNWHPLKAKIDLEEVLNSIKLSNEEEIINE